MKIKRGPNKADVRFLSEQLVSKLFNIEQCFLWHAPDGYEFVITAGRDGKHRPDSKHYVDQAIDCRVHYISNGKVCYLEDNDVELIAKDLRDMLGNWYQVVVEYQSNGKLSHVHIEFDP